jgi:uncharacterized sulfatase
LRFINKGLTPDEVAKRVKLPEKLEKHPYLREFYGTVPWSVKGVFQLYLGWFSGDPVELFPLSTPEKASRVIALAGGVDRVISEGVSVLMYTSLLGLWPVHHESYKCSETLNTRHHH